MQNKKYLVIKEEIQKMLKGMKENDAIPSERDLAEHFKTTRTTVRNAIDLLVKEGLVYKTVGRKGTLVSGPKLHIANNNLTGFTADILSKGLKPGFELLDLKELKADKKLAKHLAVPIDEPIIRVLRLRTVNDQPVSVEETFMPKTLVPNLMNEKNFPDSLYNYIEKELHLKIKSSKQYVSAISVPEAYREVMRLAKSDPVIHIENIALLQDGRIFEFSNTYQSGKRYKLYYTSSR